MVNPVSISLVFEVNRSLSDALDHLEKEAPGLVIRKISRDLAPNARKKLKHIFLRAPAPPDRPIDWTSERQRKKVMALLRARGMTNGYVRSGNLIDSWDLSITRVGAGLEIGAVNTADYATYVYGPKQKQRFLYKWPAVEDELETLQVDLEDDLEQLWYDTVETLMD